MPLWRGSQSPPRRHSAPAKVLPRPTAAAAAAPRTSGSCLFTVRTVGSIHSVSVHVAARQQPYTITPLCALLLKNQDTHTYTVHTIIFALHQVQDCTPFICTHMQGQRSSNIKIKLFFSHLKYTGKSYL